MSEPFVGEIRMFAGNFAPRGWAFCDGQLLAVSQNDALFSLLGTVYGGDGRTTFGLPEMRGRIPIHQGTGPGLSRHQLGARAGLENETLTTNEMPSHRHDAQASTSAANESSPQGRVLGSPSNHEIYAPVSGAHVSLVSTTIGDTGGSRSHTNLMPALCINYIIALVGIYPSRQ